MGKITSKYQVSIPKTLAEQLHLAPGDDVEWRLSGDGLRVTRSQPRDLSTKKKLELFDAATKRQQARERNAKPSGRTTSRGWTRDELYDRGRTR